MLGSSLSYAVGNVYARRNVHGLPPMIPALFQVTFAAVIVIPIALLVDRPFATVTPEPERDRRRPVAGAPRLRPRVHLLFHGPAGVGRDPDLDGRPTCCRSSGSSSARSSWATRSPPTGSGAPLLIIAGIGLVNGGPALRRLVPSRAQAGAGAGST